MYQVRSPCFNLYNAFLSLETWFPYLSLIYPDDYSRKASFLSYIIEKSQLNIHLVNFSPFLSCKCNYHANGV